MKTKPTLKWVILLTTHPKKGKSGIDFVGKYSRPESHQIMRGLTRLAVLLKGWIPDDKFKEFDTFDEARKYSEKHIDKNKYTITITPDFRQSKTKKDLKNRISAWHNIFRIQK